MLIQHERPMHDVCALGDTWMTWSKHLIGKCVFLTWSKKTRKGFNKVFCSLKTHLFLCITCDNFYIAKYNFILTYSEVRGAGNQTELSQLRLEPGWPVLEIPAFSPDPIALVASFPWQHFFLSIALFGNDLHSTWCFAVRLSPGELT